MCVVTDHITYFKCYVHTEHVLTPSSCKKEVFDYST